MEKNIYDLMNETTVQLEDYDVIQLTELEKKRALKKITGQSNKKKGKYQKYMAAASVAALFVASVGALPIMASTNATAYKIASILGIEANLDDYTTQVNKVVMDKGISIGLGEVLYDKEGDVLMVTNYVSTDLFEGREFTGGELNRKVYINGKRLNASSGTQAKRINDNTVAYITTYNMSEDLEGSNDIKIKIRQLFIGDKEYRGKWDMAFSMDGTLFDEATQRVDINQTLDGINGEVGIVKYVNNPMGQSIYYTHENSESIELRGTDNNGNKIVFGLAKGVYQSLYKLVLAPGYEIHPDATMLTLELYEREIIPLAKPQTTISGDNVSTKVADVSEDYKATGEVVTITLP